MVVDVVGADDGAASIVTTHDRRFRGDVVCTPYDVLARKADLVLAIRGDALTADTNAHDVMMS